MKTESGKPKSARTRKPKRVEDVPQRVRRVVASGAERQTNHRTDFKHCPSCDHAMENRQWDAAAVTLVLEPAYYKAGCVAIVSECPKCFEPSWVHANMSGFAWDDVWPDDWKAAVEEREAVVKLVALRDWGAGLCHSCKHLTSGKVNYHAWRHCMRGSGPATKTCDDYTPIAPAPIPQEP